LTPIIIISSSSSSSSRPGLLPSPFSVFFFLTHFSFHSPDCTFWGKTRYQKVVVVGVSGGVMIFPFKRKQAGRQMINPKRPNIIPQNKVYQSPFTKQTWRNVKRAVPSPKN